MVYVTFLGTAWLLRGNGHIRVDIIQKFLGRRAQALMELVSNIIGLIVSVVLVGNGFYVTFDHFQKGIYNPTIFEIPLWIVLIIIPVGSILLVVQFLRNIFDLVTRKSF
jgi:TRAP-type C4-dicarboxylate transport system permease small subunit